MMRALKLVVVGAALVGFVGACDAEPVPTTAAPTIPDVTTPVAISVTLSLDIDQPLTQPVSVDVLDADGLTVAEAEFEAAWDYPPGYRTGDPEPPESGAPTELELTLSGPGMYEFKVSSVVVGQPCGTCMNGYRGGRFEFAVEDGDHLVLPIGELDWVS